MDLKELLAQPLAQARPADFLLDEVVVRLVRPDERVKWDALMDRHHYLGFKRFAGRGLRYVAERNGRWLALAGWRAGRRPPLSVAHGTSGSDGAARRCTGVCI